MDLLFWIPLGLVALLLSAFVLAEYFRVNVVRTVLNKLVRLRPPSLKRLNERNWLNVDELAYVEKLFPNLRHVVVICARIDQPNRALADAVLDNFQEGVRYSFFVAQGGHSHDELADYHSWFGAIFDVARRLAPAEGGNSMIHGKKLDNLFNIALLTINWSNVPYVFYSYEDTAGRTNTVCYRGTQRGSGISEYYQRVQPPEAFSIIELCGAASDDFRNVLSPSSSNLDGRLDVISLVPRRKAS